jgi:hypothetical protein
VRRRKNAGDRTGAGKAAVHDGPGILWREVYKVDSVNFAFLQEISRQFRWMTGKTEVDTVFCDVTAGGARVQGAHDAKEPSCP